MIYLTDNQLLALKTDFIKMVAESQKIPAGKLNFDKLFDQWLNNKQYFYEQFGKQLIYKSKEKVTFHLDDDTRRNRVSNFLEWLNTEYIWADTHNADLAGLYDFVNNNKNDFFNNKLQVEYKDEIHYQGYYQPGEIVSIPAGIKFIKAFKYFIKDKELLFEIQNKASMIIQEDKIEGYLCLSIHPLDYLTISENTLGWRSCHSLDGDYRGGNLNYMADSSTVICYLESDSLTKIYKVPWNNKKWRVLLFFGESRQTIFAGRQYPFTITNGLDQVRNLLISSGLCDENWSDWNKGINKVDVPIKTIFKYPFYNLGKLDGLVSLDKLVYENTNHLYYNDLLRSTQYTNPYYMIELKDSKQNIRIPYNALACIGRDVTCPICKERVITSSEWMLCDKCAEQEMEEEELFVCSYCQKTITPSEMLIVGDHSDIVCEECAKEYTGFCDKCGNRYHKDELKWHEKTQQTLCEWCTMDVENIKTKKEPMIGHIDLMNDYYRINITNISPLNAMEGGIDDGSWRFS